MGERRSKGRIIAIEFYLFIFLKGGLGDICLPTVTFECLAKSITRRAQNGRQASKTKG
jgi:hypothetical protein